MDRLDELVKLPRNWDGYGGQPTRFEVAYFAMSVLEAICDDDVDCPQMVPGDSGDVQLEWHRPGASIELHIVAPNRAHAWRDINGVEEERTLSVDFSPVAEWISQLQESPVASVAAAAG